MKRWLYVLMLLLAMPILARAETRFLKPSTQITEIIEAIYGPQASIRDIWQYRGFSLGGPGDIGRIEISSARDHIATISSEEDGVWIGATDPRRYDPRFTGSSKKMNELYNHDLRIARATFMNAQTGFECLPSLQGIENDVRGAYLVVVKRPPGMATLVPGRPVPTKRETLVVKREFHHYSGSGQQFWFRPAIGGSFIATDPTSYLSPLIAGTAGGRLGRYDVGIYAAEGQDFQPDNRGLTRYGLQLGDELGWAFRLGYQSNSSEIRGDGHTTRRREGGEAGLSFGWPAVSLSLFGNVGWYSDLHDRDGRIEPGISGQLTIGPIFRTTSGGNDR